jgi:hypothetical protein
MVKVFPFLLTMYPNDLEDEFYLRGSKCRHWLLEVIFVNVC